MNSLLALCLLFGTGLASQINSYKDTLRVKFQRQIKAQTVNYQYFTQIKDHNNPSQGTFQQRYYVDDEYYDKDNGGPIFLEMGGEAPINATILPFELHYELAQRYKGLLIILEHRFYGPDNLSPGITASLGSSKLSSQLATFNVDQALADGYNFIKTYSKDVNSKSRWITVGGSYPGNLAAWMRLKYPDVVYAAHSSSAPVLAKSNYWEYGYAVYIGLSKTLVELGFTKSTADACATGWKRAVTVNDQQGSSTVIPAVSRLLSGIVQYGLSQQIEVGFQNVDMMDYICSGKYLKTFTDPSASDEEVLSDYFALYNTIKSQSGGSPTIAQEDLLLWVYQGCAEFGFFQLYDPAHPDTAFSSKLSLHASLEACKVLYTLNPPNIDNFNSKYQGLGILNYTTNVVFVHGTTDPWSYLGIKSALNTSNTYIEVQGGHHCSDMHKITNNSTTEAKRVHGLVLDAWDKIMNQTSAPTPLMALPPSATGSTDGSKQTGSAFSYSLISAFFLIAVNVLV
ncbi:hypothetical protein HDV01_000202 [Terramyces sp. JEL0728]|nr:hypothetical protein HDV01_000202 [Terramyces sp. JEL0728]